MHTDLGGFRRIRNLELDMNQGSGKINPPKSACTRVTPTPNPILLNPPRSVCIRVTSYLFIYVLLLTILPLFSLLEGKDIATPPPLYPGFEGFHREIHTSDPTAQRYFDQGLILFYGYNFAEAARSFRQAEQYDPQCALCYWGEALALSECAQGAGDPWAMQASTAALRAQVLANAASAKDKALVQSLLEKFQIIQNQPTPALQKYAATMKVLHQKYPNDPDITALYAKSAMEALGSDRHENIAIQNTLLQILADALKKNPNHVGLNHLNIHVAEAIGKPGEALQSADLLGKLVPGSGHLQHMPAHIYMHLGRYHDASAANQRGIAADDKLFREGALKIPEFAGFYLHNYFYLFASLTMEGRSSDALSTSNKLIGRLISGDLPSNPYLQDVFFSVPYLLMARFGKWEDVIKASPPPSDLFFAKGAMIYSQGLADIRSGHSKNAQASLVELKKNKQLFDAQKVDDPTRAADLSHLFDLMGLDLEAQIAASQGNHAKAIQNLKMAVTIEDNLDTSMLPWYLPMRQALATELLTAGQFPEALKVFEEDLKRHPNNGWSLFGLTKTLHSENKFSKNAQENNDFQKAWRFSDLILTSPRF